ncbi:MAG: Ig-like domain-containing protein [Candidatus Binatia bacterium]
MRQLARAVMALLVLGAAAPAPAQVAMPDARQMSGVPLPAGDLANGTVTVRVVRERMGNNVPNQEVTLTTPEGAVSGVTDAEGRAEFTSVAPGAKVTASTRIDGEILRSQEFTVPAAGGVRVALVAGADKAAAAEDAANKAAAAGPARPGAVVFGADTRIVLEFQNDDPTFFYIFSVVNNARTPVVPPAPLALTLPSKAEQASLVSGPPGLARLDKGVLQLSGPFPPGQTAFQVAFRMPLASTIHVSQAWPAPVEGFLVAAQRAGGLEMTSPQLSGIREGDNGGQPFVVGTAGRLNEGQAVELTFSHVPAPPAWPFWTAVIAAAVGLLWTLWAITGAAPDHGRERQALLAERERLLGAIAALDAEARARGADAKRDAKRERLMAAVEQVYARLDELPGGSGQAA